jgi:hypothetical protein
MCSLLLIPLQVDAISDHTQVQFQFQAICHFSRWQAKLARMVARTARMVASGGVHLVGFRVFPWLDNPSCSWPWQPKNTMGAVSMHILKIDGTHDLCLVAFDC